MRNARRTIRSHSTSSLNLQKEVPRVTKMYFSLHYQYIVKQAGNENKEDHHLGDTVVMYNKFLKLALKEIYSNQSGKSMFAA